MKDEALLKKLKFKPKSRILVLNAPEGFLSRVVDENMSVDSNENHQLDAVLLFAHKKSEMEQYAPQAFQKLKYDGLFWIAYPKGTSRIKTDINRDRGWDIISKARFDGVSAISIDDTWSAIRFRQKELIKRQKEKN